MKTPYYCYSDNFISNMNDRKDILDISSIQQLLNVMTVYLYILYKYFKKTNTFLYKGYQCSKSTRKNYVRDIILCSFTPAKYLQIPF